MGEEDSKNALMIQELNRRVQRLETQVASIRTFQHPPSPSPSPSPQPHRYDDRNSSSYSYSSSSSSPKRRKRPRKRHQRRDPVNISLPTPFSARIQKFPLPKVFIRPTDMKYDGATDPQDHLDNFAARMNPYKVEDAIWCRAFPVTLSGPAMKWFNSLPPGSVTCFADISRMLLVQFKRIKVMHPIQLLDVVQKEGESIRDYLERFKRALLDVNTRSPDVVSFCFVAGLRGGDFRRYLLSTDRFISMEEIQQQIALQYM